MFAAKFQQEMIRVDTAPDRKLFGTNLASEQRDPFPRADLMPSSLLRSSVDRFAELSCANDAPEIYETPIIGLLAVLAVVSGQQT